MVRPALILILGDQLTPAMASLRGADPARDVVAMAEVAAEAGYADHHKQKLALIFAAMRHFAQELRAAGWRVIYRRIDEEAPAPTLLAAVADALAITRAGRVVVAAPGEWRLWEEMQGWDLALGVDVALLEDDRFLCSRGAFVAWAKDRRRLVMEDFYRLMRRRAGLLMEGDAPAGGRWNFDAENRAGWREAQAEADLFRAPPPVFARDAVDEAVVAMVRARFPDHFGRLDRFDWATRRADAEAARDWFLAHALPGFGRTQDAMLRGDPRLNHSLLSPYVNLGLLDPLDLCRRVEAEWRAGRVPLASAEGFIRQIIGWREYMRGLYWLDMPAYRERNALDARRPLPDFYWTGDTDLACLEAVIGQTLDTGYAHHIQRLMIAGAFAMMIGANPKAVHEWYLGVYVDAFEWVELPNTLGMSQHADGGLTATKPYAASAAYVSRMSDYCRACRYDARARLGDSACPWNALYWDFIGRHLDRWRANPRMRPIVKSWEAMKEEDRAAIRAKAGAFIAGLPSTYAARRGRDAEKYRATQ